MFADAGDKGDYRTANSVFDGHTVHLAGARGEYVSYQLCVENGEQSPQKDLSVRQGNLLGPEGSSIGEDNIEYYRNWYARNKDKKWQPAYCVPMKTKDTFEIPDATRNLEGQRNQTIYIDVLHP